MSRSDQTKERRITLVNRRTGEEVLLATISPDGRNVDVPNSIDRPLVVAIREMCLYSQEGDIVMTGEDVGRDYAELCSGMIGHLADTIFALRNSRGVDASVMDDVSSALHSEAANVIERQDNA